MNSKQCRECRGYEEHLLCPHFMVELLASKLTKDEFNQLADMIDGDPPAGPLWEAVQDKNSKLSPELYVFNKQTEKEEVLTNKS